ncbi:hypothetical protein V1478_018842 [Vespula squamosa]|uniref:Uncharacterized protein n=1 Tax=Vespula squamosa TaxID=30214 RepID=A0ABD1ZTY2_VESSQ
MDFESDSLRKRNSFGDLVSMTAARNSTRPQKFPPS